MEKCGLESYAPMETALKEAGFEVDKIAKQGKKTVITVTHQLPQSECRQVEYQKEETI